MRNKEEVEKVVEGHRRSERQGENILGIANALGVPAPEGSVTTTAISHFCAEFGDWVLGKESDYIKGLLEAVDAENEESKPGKSTPCISVHVVPLPDGEEKLN